jgi:hypothetical protein
MAEQAADWEMVDELRTDEEVLVLKDRLEWPKKAGTMVSLVFVFLLCFLCR